MEYICEKCIDVVAVREEVKKLNIGENTCFYCGNVALVAHKKDIFSFIEDNFFSSILPISECSSMEQASFWGGSDELSVKEIWEIIQNLELGNDKLETDLIDYMSEGLTSSDNLFVIDDGTLDNNIYEDKWLGFIESISHDQRFFNNEVKIFLDELFSVIHENKVVSDEICTILEPNISLFRARIANSKAERESIISNPSGQLGPVPRALAGEQRMTPRGISAFYASSDRETCFSEVRAITGDMVISGEFIVNRALKLLDLTKLEKLSKKAYHLFEPNFSEKSHKGYFLNKLMFLLSKPASNRKSSNYLETQVIFEYFRVNFGDDISGLIFPSVQTGLNGLNAVLFPENSNVNPFQYKPSLELMFKECYHPEIGAYIYLKHDIKEVGSADNCSTLTFVEGSLELHYIKEVKTIAERKDVYISCNEI
ncbi:TPA: RES family NAD+ phosphorylase [Vibrio vulnificus]